MSPASEMRIRSSPPVFLVYRLPRRSVSIRWIRRSGLISAQKGISQMADVHTMNPVRIDDSNNPLSRDEQRKMDAYWRAANYLSVGQIYLYANAMLREPLTIKHIKPRLLGHWGTTPGLNFI